MCCRSKLDTAQKARVHLLCLNLLTCTVWVDFRQTPFVVAFLGRQLGQRLLQCTMALLNQPSSENRSTRFWSAPIHVVSSRRDIFCRFPGNGLSALPASMTSLPTSLSARLGGAAGADASSEPHFLACSESPCHHSDYRSLATDLCGFEFWTCVP